MSRAKILTLLAIIIALAVLPLLIVERPELAPGEESKLFGGADDQAKDLIGEIAPTYQPWFEPWIEPASGEIASLLFALQAALGAGVIGYYLGVSVTREKYRRAKHQTAEPLAKRYANAD